MRDRGHRRRTMLRWLCTCGDRFPCERYRQQYDRIPAGRIPDGDTVSTWEGWTVGPVGRR